MQTIAIERDVDDGSGDEPEPVPQGLGNHDPPDLIDLGLHRDYSTSAFPFLGAPFARGTPGGFDATCKTSAMAASPHDDPADDEMMALALDEARAAIEHDDVPVGAVVVHDGIIIATRHNERELHHDPVAHAEILALRDAAEALDTWRLDDCTMFVTLEPCAMCAGAMVNARLGHLVYGADDPKAGAAGSVFSLLDGAALNHRVEVAAGPLADEAGELLREFFRARRAAPSGRTHIDGSS